MVKTIKVAHIGIGALGSRIVKHILKERKGIEYIGGIDIRPAVVGKDLGKVVGLDKIGVKITDDPEEVYQKDPHIAVHTTTSFLEQVYPQLKEAAENGINVISTCEQLSYPKFANEELANKLDDIAKENNVSILGTGINPGFLMDVRPFVLSTGCKDVEKIKVTRRMNASPRRKPFQKKIGAGMELEEFEQAIEEKKITGHVGLEESISLIANSLGWALDKIKVEGVETVVAEEEVSSDFFTAKEGQVKGVSQDAYGLIGEEKKIQLYFKAFLGADPSYDEIVIKGTPEINGKISPCWHGDYGTTAMVVNLIPTVINARPGLLQMNDIANLSYKAGNMGKFIS